MTEFVVVGAVELWETPEGFSKSCGKVVGGRGWPALHRTADPQPAEEGGRGEERAHLRLRPTPRDGVCVVGGLRGLLRLQ